tara:strand:+ start:280 stop:1539 length:1260 start_codon:yes stop_codon:yes gene_type:complete
MKCVLIASRKVYESVNLGDVEKDLYELESLAYTLSFSVLDKSILNLKKINPSTFYGKGQITLISDQLSAMKCKYLIFNDDISPSQYKNIQKLLSKKIKIFDRTGLILEIFKRNAKTREAKLQVELASLQYMLPRLTGQWTHLERQMGGVGTRGGPGEKQIEIDRRLIGVRISKLKKDLSNIKKNRKTQSANRKNAFRVSLVGYTNAGKSSLLNSLTLPNTTYVKDKLFATLDTTTKSIQVVKNKKVLITDTVGFIKNLPHNLVASFRSTFEEVNSSDLILTIVDSSQPKTVIDDHISTIKSTLNQMKIKVENNILIMNKLDLIKQDNSISYLRKNHPDAIFISAKNHIMIEKVKKAIYDKVCAGEKIHIVKIPFEKSFLVHEVYSKYNVVENISKDGFVELSVSTTTEEFEKIKKMARK